MTKIAVENVNSPGKTTNVDAAKYTAMHDALIKALPVGAPAMKVADLRAALDPYLSQEHFPGGSTAGWWLKCVQLDLEAKGVLVREPKPPVRLARVK